MGAARKDAVLASLGLRAEDATVQLLSPEGQEQAAEVEKRVPLSEVLARGTDEEKREAHKAKSEVQSKLRDKVMCKVVCPMRHGLCPKKCRCSYSVLHIALLRHCASHCPRLTTIAK